MAGNRRGKLKEKFEGIHRNFEWSKKHCDEALVLIQHHNPKLSGAITGLLEGMMTLDELAQKIYSRI